MSDVGELIAEYAAEAAVRGEARCVAQRAARHAVAEARASVQAAEWRVARAKQDLGMKRATLTRAIRRLGQVVDE